MVDFEVWRKSPCRFSEEELFSVVREILQAYDVDEVPPSKWELYPDHSLFFEGITKPILKECCNDDGEWEKKLVTPVYRLHVRWTEKISSVDWEVKGSGLFYGSCTGLKFDEDLKALPSFLNLNALKPRAFRQMSLF